MTNIELAKRLIDIAKNYKTLYVLGCFGAPLYAANKKRYSNNYEYNKKAARTAKINAASDDTFGFDCVCLIKGVLWGWEGDKGEVYGGAGYAINGVPDIGADAMIKKCSDVTTDFTDIEIGEAVWMSGHIGVYVGDGLAVECTPKWADGVQLTACNRSVSGYNRRDWTKHGKLPYITYEKAAETPKPTAPAPALTVMNAAETKAAFYKYLTEELGLNSAAACGVLANINAESAFKSTNLQQTYEKSLGFTDASYTEAVDNGTYTNFVKDAAGYGLAQWTYWSRKQKLLDFAKSKGKSIGDAVMQMQFFGQEIKGYSGVWNTLRTVPNTAEGAYKAGYEVCYHYEAPANKAVRSEERGKSAQKYFADFGGSSAPAAPVTPPATADFAVGDKVYVTGKIYAYGNGTGNSLTKDNSVMYICEFVDSKSFPHYIGVSAVKGGRRQGWAKPDILSKTSTAKPATPAEPKPSAGTTQGYIEYPVQSGDTLTKIATKYKTTIAKIVAANGIKDANKIYVNQILKIPTEGVTAPVTTAKPATFAVGDAVVVNGTITAFGNGGGNKLTKNGVRMYVCDIENSKVYPNYIGVSAVKGSARQGWANPEILTKQ